MDHLDETIESFGTDAHPDIKARWKRLGVLTEGENQSAYLVGRLAHLYASGSPLSEAELDVMERLVKSAPFRPVEHAFFYLDLRNLEGKEKIEVKVAEAVRIAVTATLNAIEPAKESLLVYKNQKSELLPNLKAAFGDQTEMPFWEDYRDWESIHANPREQVNQMSSRTTGVVRDPDTGKEFVVKSKYLELDEQISDPRKMAIFQEILRYYGVKHLEEVTVLPSLELSKAEQRGKLLRGMQTQAPAPKQIYYPFIFDWAREAHEKRKARGLRVAERMPLISLPKKLSSNTPRNPADNLGRENMGSEERALLEAWFPCTIFDDEKCFEYAWSYRENGGTGTESVNVINLNPAKFEKWYGNLDSGQREKTRASLEAVYHLVNDGFLLDLYGGLNFAFRDGEFTLIDVEPLQLSNIPSGTECLGYSERILNAMFKTVGLPEISYQKIVDRHYGGDKYLKLFDKSNGRLNIDGGRIDPPKEFWGTNITNEEELALYRRKLAEKQAEKGMIPRPDILPPALIAEHQKLLEMSDDFFTGERYDWTKREWGNRDFFWRRLQGG